MHKKTSYLLGRNNFRGAAIFQPFSRMLFIANLIAYFPVTILNPTLWKTTNNPLPPPIRLII